MLVRKTTYRELFVANPEASTQSTICPTEKSC